VLRKRGAPSILIERLIGICRVCGCVANNGERRRIA
jgi:hypothetical protein